MDTESDEFSQGMFKCTCIYMYVCACFDSTVDNKSTVIWAA